jgi:predicted transcriptional regulator
VDKKKQAPMEEKPTPKRVTQAKKQDKKEKEPAVKVESVNRSLAELSEDEKKVLASITAQGVTVSAIQSKAGKGLKYAALLRALRNLIDSGYVGIVTKGKMTLYQKITVEKMDKQKNEENKTEVN